MKDAVVATLFEEKLEKRDRGTDQHNNGRANELPGNGITSRPKRTKKPFVLAKRRAKMLEKKD